MAQSNTTINVIVVFDFILIVSTLVMRGGAFGVQI